MVAVSKIVRVGISDVGAGCSQTDTCIPAYFSLALHLRQYMVIDHFQGAYQGPAFEVRTVWQPAMWDAEAGKTVWCGLSSFWLVNPVDCFAAIKSWLWSAICCRLMCKDSSRPDTWSLVTTQHGCCPLPPRQVMISLPSMGWFCIKFNSLGPRKNGRLSADDIFKRIFFNENSILLI